MTICGGQRDAPRNIIPRTNFRRDAGPSTALAGYATPPGCDQFVRSWRSVSDIPYAQSTSNRQRVGDASVGRSTSPSATARPCRCERYRRSHLTNIGCAIKNATAPVTKPMATVGTMNGQAFVFMRGYKIGATARGRPIAAYAESKDGNPTRKKSGVARTRISRCLRSALSFGARRYWRRITTILPQSVCRARVCHFGFKYTIGNSLPSSSLQCREY